MSQLDPGGSAIAFECPSCGGNQAFEPGTPPVLRCGSCAHAVPIDRADGPVPTHRLDAAPDPAAGVPAGAGQEFTCPGCAGRLAFVGSLATTQCPFCGTPVQQSDIQAAPGRLTVDGVLPFDFDVEKARELALAVLDGTEDTAPTPFVNASRTAPITPVYLPFVVFARDAVVDYKGKKGKYDRNRSREAARPTYGDWEKVEGTGRVSLSHVGIPADDATTIDKPESFLLAGKNVPEGAVPFRSEYLAGIPCRVQDRDLAECDEAAKEQATERADVEVGRQVGGDVHDWERFDVTWGDTSYYQLLYPVYVMTVPWQGKPRTVWIDGASGNVEVGDLPADRRIMIGCLAVIAVAVLLFALAAVLM